jgi:hypothetical protein
VIALVEFVKVVLVVLEEVEEALVVVDDVAVDEDEFGEELAVAGGLITNSKFPTFTWHQVPLCIDEPTKIPNWVPKGVISPVWVMSVVTERSGC